MPPLPGRDGTVKTSAIRGIGEIQAACQWKWPRASGKGPAGLQCSPPTCLKLGNVGRGDSMSQNVLMSQMSAFPKVSQTLVGLPVQKGKTADVRFMLQIHCPGAAPTFDLTVVVVQRPPPEQL